ncbi:MAG: AbrB/MazE/SpoVT family DNA-binding domain-containing protein [Burkholderiales bacterium]|jgi:AbrB family looped-hinge helix DNA binding protein|nr:AbrB/MazE/SpoVT family DNA-binding domain-containing protein [Burkholderiales bacterium]
MAAATLTARGQIVIPAEIRDRYGLVAGTQVEFVDDAGSIRLVVHRRVPRTDPEAGYGLVKVPPAPADRPRGRLVDFDAATLAQRARRGRS